MGAAEKPGLSEQVGVAMNAAHVPELLIGAFGAAALAVRLGVDVDDVPIGAAPAMVKPEWAWPRSPLVEHRTRGRIVSELAALLWHVRNGRQLEQRGAAARLFAEWMLEQREFWYLVDLELRRQVLARFSVMALQEWLFDRCTYCGGTGQQQRLPTGHIVRPRGIGERNAVLVPCRSCKGSKLAPPNKVLRARGLGITTAAYDDSRWPRRFRVAHIWLEQISRRLNRPLTAETGRRIRRPEL